jgi:hypothetical protein
MLIKFICSIHVVIDFLFVVINFHVSLTWLVFWQVWINSKLKFIDLVGYLLSSLATTDRSIDLPMLSIL